MKNPHYITLTTSLLMIIAVLLIFNYLPPEVPFLYGNIQGQEQLVPKLFLIIGPIGSIFISFLNNYISKKVDDELYKKALSATSILVNIMVAITLTKIIFLVGLF